MGHDLGWVNWCMQYQEAHRPKNWIAIGNFSTDVDFPRDSLLNDRGLHTHGTDNITSSANVGGNEDMQDKKEENNFGFFLRVIPDNSDKL